MRVFRQTMLVLAGWIFVAIVFLPQARYTIPHFYALGSAFIFSVLILVFWRALFSLRLWIAVTWIVLAEAIIAIAKDPSGFGLDLRMTTFLVSSIIISISLYLSFVAFCGKGAVAWFVIGALFIFWIMFFNTLHGDIGASRSLAGNTKDVLAAQIKAFDIANAGVMDYGGIHSLPMLATGIVAAIKLHKNLLLRGFLLATIVTLVATMVHASYAMAMVSMVLGCCVVLVPVNRRKLAIIIGVAAFLMFFIALKCGLITMILESIAQGMSGGEHEMNLNKIYELIDLSKGKAKGDVAHRYYLYGLSFDEFLNHPLVGGEIENTGRHSFLLDVLGYKGLLGFSALIGSYLLILTMVRRFLLPSRRGYFTIVCLVYLMLLIYKSATMYMQDVVVLLIVPCLLSVDRDGFLYSYGQVCRILRLPVRIR